VDVAVQAEQRLVPGLDVLDRRAADRPVLDLAQRGLHSQLVVEGGGVVELGVEGRRVQVEHGTFGAVEVLCHGFVGFGELLLIFIVILLIFGASKLPQLGDALGKGIKNFKRSVSGEDEE